MKKKYPVAFKFKVALEALRGDKTVADICRENNVAPSLVHKWKTHLRDRGSEVLALSADVNTRMDEIEKTKLYEEIGRLKVELDFLKKSLGS